ncbi:MAG TPA: class I SAM-dependent methyltransferase [Candidatus Paceibacterota bacterium]|nr:class I SAM-dependent methyltransferase [Candidatus Paceibacterota bacterium]
MFTDPVKNLRAFGLKEDDIVVDLGAGTGYYSISAGHIAHGGKVYAIEIDRDFLHTIKNRAKDARLSNVEIILGDISKLKGTKIKDGIADVVIASNILFQVEDKEQLILEIKRILKQKGRVLLIDWSDSGVMGTKKNIVPKSKAREMFEKKGFILQRDIDAGAHHYGMILIKK